ncbi:MAG: hypothetical protein KAT17_07170, partial [Candidatus Aminicenantes bacterium]|nr:hypothetical protein [Candidatus Aminicenantes bacterium]
LMLNGRFCYTDGGFTLDPRGSDIMDNEFNGQQINAGNDWQFIAVPRQYLGSMYHYLTDRNTINLSLDGNYFLEGFIGGDHEIRFGVDYYTGDTTTTTLFPNNRIAYTHLESDPSYYQSLWLTPNTKLDVTFNRISFYLSDTAQFGKLSVNLGARYDKESGKINSTVNPAFTWYEPGSPFHGTNPFPTLLGEMNQVAGDSPMSYEVISPRLSLSYDITGDGKNVVKFTAARYGSQSGNSLSTRYAYVNREVDVYWYDDGDFVPEYTEINWGVIAWTNTDRIDYSTGWRKCSVDPDFNSPLLDELSLSFEKALGEDLAVSVSGFYKKRHNLTRAIGVMSSGQLETEANNWYYAGDYTFLDGSTAPYYLRNEQPGEFYYTNYDNDTYERYMAVVLQFSKKFSNKWMFDASFTYADWKAFYKKEDYDCPGNGTGAGDLTNYDYYNEAVNAPAVSGSSGLSGIFVNARWQVKASGLYQLPWGINITGVMQAREGYVLPYHESMYRSGIRWTNMYKLGEKFGDNRLPTFWMLSLGLEKTFKISETATATLFVDGYNITNNVTTLLVETDYAADNFDQPLRILNPGIFQFGIRVSF